MTPVERIALEAIALIPGVPEDARRLLNDLASGRRPLNADGSRGDDVSPSTRRWRAYRARQAQKSAGEGQGATELPFEPSANAANGDQTPSNAPANAFANAPANASNGPDSPPDPPEIPSDSGDLVPSERGSETRVRAAANAAQTLPQTPAQTLAANAPTRAANEMADGCFGAAVKAWGAGIEAVTGKRFLLPRPGGAELTKLVDALVTAEPDLTKREAWARTQGEAFARALGGKARLSPHSFVDWLNSPAQRPVGADELAAKKRADERADAADLERKKYIAKASAPPPEALAVLAQAGLVAKRA